MFQYGRELRQKSTKAEKILWDNLRNRKLDGLKFRRQHLLDKYVADFCCHEKKLIIELDGAVHLDKMSKDYDKARTFDLSGSAIKVIRFWNSEVENNIGKVLNQIREYLKSQ